MKWNRQPLAIFAITLALFLFQNCSQIKFQNIQTLSLKKSDGDNGSVFDGKPTYYLTRPGYTCEGQLAPLAFIQMSTSGPLLTFNQNDQCGAISNQPIDQADFDKFSFDPDFVGYRDGIYELQPKAPDFTSPVYNEAWCQSSGSGTNLTVGIKFDGQNNIASSQIHYSTGTQTGAIKSFSVSRLMNDSSAEYQATGFHLLVDRTMPAPQKWWYFDADLQTDKVPGSWKGHVLCRMASSKLLATVQKIYPKNSDWNSYVKNADTAKDIFSQSDNTCPVGATGWNQCIHGGDKLVVETDLPSCAKLNIQDQLDIFNWICEERPTGAIFKTNRLKNGKGLSDLITKNGWKTNSLQITQEGHVRYESMALPWWKNPIVPLLSSGSTVPLQLNVSKAIYVVDSNLSVPGIQVAADNISLVIQKGATVTGQATMNPNCNLSGATFSANDGTLYPMRCLLTSENHNFLWIEGAFDSAGSNSRAGINIRNGQFMRLQNVTIQNAAGGFGLFLNYMNASVLEAVKATGNKIGLAAQTSVGNLIGYSEFSNNTSTGLWLMTWDNENTIVNSTAAQNGITGFSFNASKNLSMVSNKSVSNTVRGFEVTSFTENAIFESTVASGDSYGLDLERTMVTTLKPNIYIDTAMMSTTVGLRVFDGTGFTKDFFEGDMYLGSTSNCSVMTNPAINCPGTGLPGSEIFQLPTTVLSTFSSCSLSSDGDSILCAGGKSSKTTCQLPDHLSNPLINWSMLSNVPLCKISDVLK